MPSAPSVVVFDVNETLSDMSPMATRFADVGAPGDLAKLWFAVLLRDGFALTAAGGQERFSVLAENALQAVLTGMPLDRPGDAAVEHVMAGFMNLPVHPDVPSGIRAMSDVGIPLVTLTNGSTEVAEWLLTTAGIATSSRHSCRSKRQGHGSLLAAPTSTPQRRATQSCTTCCWFQFTRGTSTAPLAPGCEPRGLIENTLVTRPTSPLRSGSPKELLVSLNNSYEL
jgi:2-haloalkanoic acid dehalogenase type II